MTVKEALDNIAVYSATHNNLLDTSVEAISKELEVMNVLQRHPLLDLSTIPDYFGDYDSYIDEYKGTTNELSYDEFLIIDKWQDVTFEGF